MPSNNQDLKQEEDRPKELDEDRPDRDHRSSRHRHRRRRSHDDSKRHRRHSKKYRKRYRYDSSSSDSSSASSSSSSSSTSSSEEERRRRKRRHKRRKERKERKRRHKESKRDSSKDASVDTTTDGSTAKEAPTLRLLVATPITATTTTPTDDRIPLPLQKNNTTPAQPDPAKQERQQRMVPMTKEEYERQQSIVREVYDPESGRMRLVRGTGEIIERIVSRSDHQRINQTATRGDGNSFAQGVFGALRKQQRR